MNKIVWHQVVLFLILLGLTILRLLLGQTRLDLDLIWWWLGGVIGFLFVFCDRLVYVLVSNRQEVLSVKIKELFGRGKLVAGLAMVFSEREKQKHLVMRSVLFVVVWAVLAIFTVTSVGSGFARGLVLGLGTHLVFDLWWDYRAGNREIEDWFWQVKNITNTERDWFVRIAIVFYLLIFWFL